MGLMDYLLEKVRGRKQDINLPDEKPVTPERTRAFQKERSNDEIEKFKHMGKVVQGLFPAKGSNGK